VCAGAHLVCLGQLPALRIAPSVRVLLDGRAVGQTSALDVENLSAVFGDEFVVAAAGGDGLLALVISAETSPLGGRGSVCCAGSIDIKAFAAVLSGDFPVATTCVFQFPLLVRPTVAGPLDNAAAVVLRATIDIDVFVRGLSNFREGLNGGF
jgi:hypothetical protein